MNIMNLTFDPKRHQIFQPVNIQKYKGQVFPTARSSWEWNFYNWCDKNNSITSWAVESFAIPYFDPSQRKNRNYFPDVIMSVRNSQNRDVVYIVEIKPMKEVIPPRIGKKKEKTMIREGMTYQTNMAKWAAAEKFCKQRGYIFRIITEKDLFKDGKPS